MIKDIRLLFLCLVVAPAVTAQHKKIAYGSNPSAGKYYSIRNIQLYCEIYGKGKPLLLIHGNGGSINAFENNIAYFSKHYKVIAVDSRAQGRSTDNGDSLSFEMMADDFAALLDKLHIDSAYIIGWSDGGINAIVMALRHPGKVIKFAATGANLRPDSTAFGSAGWKEMQQYYEANRNKVRSSAKERNDWKLFLLDCLQPDILPAALEKIKCPALIIAGDHDVIATEHTVDIYKHIPAAELWILPGCGHSTLVEQPAIFNQTVDHFFSK
ncbi:MAG: alpha/beta hydrolase [Ferruginibacter sp.]